MRDEALIKNMEKVTNNGKFILRLWPMSDQTRMASNNTHSIKSLILWKGKMLEREREREREFLNGSMLNTITELLSTPPSPGCQTMERNRNTVQWINNPSLYQCTIRLEGQKVKYTLILYRVITSKQILCTVFKTFKKN